MIKKLTSEEYKRQNGLDLIFIDFSYVVTKRTKHYKTRKESIFSEFDAYHIYKTRNGDINSVKISSYHNSDETEKIADKAHRLLCDAALNNFGFIKNLVLESEDCDDMKFDSDYYLNEYNINEDILHAVIESIKRELTH